MSGLAGSSRAVKGSTASLHTLLCCFRECKLTATINIAWCPAHCSNIHGNDRADILAKETTELACTSPVGSSRANALRRAKTATLKAWTREWRTPHKHGGYTISNRFPPSLRPTKHIRELDGDRELYGRIVQCRTGHAYTCEFRQKFFPEESFDCTCGVDIETREHIIRDCPRYEPHRAILHEADRDISLPQILGTKEGIITLAAFLRTSGAPRNEWQDPRFKDEPEVPEDSGEEDADDED